MDPEETRYQHVLRAVTETPWAIRPEALTVVLDILAIRAAGHRLSDEEIQERVGAARRNRQAYDQAGGVAVVPLYGLIIPKANLFAEMSGATSLQTFRQQFRDAVASDETSAIVLDVDSPGGMTDLVTEVATEIRQARGGKPIVAIANTDAASAAYWIASQADELVATPSGLVGSIGVIAAHEDLSKAMEREGVKRTLIKAGKYKAEANPFEPLTDEARAHIQAIVDETYGMFVRDVACGRNVPVDQVREGFGQGRVVTPKAALEQGMVDRVETFEQTIDRLLSRGRRPRQAIAGAAGPTQSAEHPAGGVHVTVINRPPGPVAGSFTAAGAPEMVVDGLRPNQAASPDRPGMDNDDVTTEPQAPAEPAATPDANAQPAPAATAQPRQATPELDELARSVARLTEAVENQQNGTGDRETVERLAHQVQELQRQMPRTGYTPGDDTGLTLEGEGRIAREIRSSDGRARIDAMLRHPAGAVAEVIRRPAEAVERFQQAADNLLLLSTAFNRDPRNLDYYGDEYLPAMHAAMDTQTSAEGAEFVPTTLSSQLIERVNLQLLVVALFPEIPMPTNPFEIPGMSVGRVRGGRHVEQTADTGQTKIKKITPGSRKITLNAAKFAHSVLYSIEESEDSLIPVLDFIQDEIVDFLAADMEDACINGDADGTHYDSDVTATDDPRFNWNGLRKLVLAGANTSASNAALTDGMLRTNRKVMGKYGVRAAELVHIVGIAGYVQLLGTQNVLTVDKYGPNATVLAGELGKVDGIPIVVSEYIRQDLNASGVYDGSTTNRSVALTVFKRGFVRGVRRQTTVQLLLELYSESDQNAVKVTTRRAFEPRYPAASETIVAQTYNLAT